MQEHLVRAHQQELVHDATQRRLAVAAACCRRWGLLVRRRVEER